MNRAEFWRDEFRVEREKIGRLEAQLRERDRRIVKLLETGRELEADLAATRSQAESFERVLAQADERLAEWQRHGVKVTEDCETCRKGKVHDPDCGCKRLICAYLLDCPDCGGTGKKLRDGVTYHGIGAWRCNTCGNDCRAEGAGCEGAEYDDRSYLAFPAEWLGADDEV